MSLFFRRGAQQKRFYDASSIPLNSQVGRYGSSQMPVTQDSALRASAVWAALRLRSNLISTMPVYTYRQIGDVQVQVAGPSCRFYNGGRQIEWHEFLYATQFDLDRAGNCFGVITERNALGLPAAIELVNLADVAVQPRRQGSNPLEPDLTYRIGGSEYDAKDVWHERQYTVAGLCVGLNAVAYAAMSIGSYSTAQEFSQRWFGQDAMPAAMLKNVERVLTPAQSAEVKARYQASMSPGGVFVTGSDWELKPMNAAMETNRYIETMQFGVPDIARFFDVPADLIDGGVSGSSITYANIQSRNLQLLIMNLGPAIVRREKALSQLVPGSRFIKLNTDALLRMDPQTKANVLKTEIDSRTRTPDEARALNNLAPLDQADKDLFKELFPGKSGGVPTTDEQPAEETDEPATP